MYSVGVQKFLMDDS